MIVDTRKFGCDTLVCQLLGPYYFIYNIMHCITPVGWMWYVAELRRNYPNIVL